jgi:hypothetical protein
LQERQRSGKLEAMKVILLASLICLGLGFFLGKIDDENTESEGGKSIVASQRMVGDGQVRSGRSQKERHRAMEFERLIAQNEALRGEGLSSSRLQGWILQLRSEEIPAALEMLLERERKEWESDEESSREVEDEMLVLLARWYEVDGESMLGWIRSQKEWTAVETLKAEIVTITDGFHRDPRRGLELSMDWISRANEASEGDSRGAGLGETAYRDLVFYQVGRWGADPEKMLEEIDDDRKLRNFDYLKMGFPVNPSHEGYPNPTLNALALGLLDSGRTELMLEMGKRLEGTAAEAFGFAYSLSEETGNYDWQKMRGLIDAGTLQSNSYIMIEIFDEMVGQDRESALEWYLATSSHSEGSRAEAIGKLVDQSEAFRTLIEGDPEDPFTGGTNFEYEKAEAFLVKLEEDGEPVGEAWKELASNALWEGRIEKLASYRRNLATEDWAEIEEEIITNSISSTSERVKEKLLEFKSFNPHQEEAAAEFGLLGEIERRIGETNAVTRVKLQKLLDNMTDAQTR